MARCPECGQKLNLQNNLERWDHIFCDNCHAELEVLGLKPLELEAVFDFEDDDPLSSIAAGLDDDTTDDEDWPDDEGQDIEDEEEIDDDDDDDDDEW